MEATQLSLTTLLAMLLTVKFVGGGGALKSTASQPLSIIHRTFVNIQDEKETRHETPPGPGSAFPQQLIFILESSLSITSIRSCVCANSNITTKARSPETLLSVHVVGLSRCQVSESSGSSLTFP